jgi:hypothetical protein
MSRQKIVGLVMGVVLLGLTCQSAVAQTTRAAMRIGTYDSRAIAVAWAASAQNAQILNAKLEEMKRAKAAGDEKKIKELNDWGAARQKKMHLQGFAGAPVHDILEQVKEQLPGVAQRAGVDVIAGKLDYQSDSSAGAVVDVTDELVKVFKPNERTLKIIQDLKTQPPVPADVVEKMKD